MGKQVDRQTFRKPKAKPFLRTLIFIGGLVGSLVLLYLFIIGPSLIDFSIIIEDAVEVPWYLNGVYIVVGAILVGLAITVVIFKFKKVFNGWFGIFALLVSFYTLFLVMKIFLGIADTEHEEIGSIWAYLVMIIPDMFIIFYSLSTLMGKNAELLSKRLKRFGLDTVIIWLILSKVTYEFIHYFPYDLLSGVPIPWIQWFSTLNNDLVNHIRNIAVLIFFVILLIIIGIYEIRKYSLAQLELKKEVDEEVKELLSPQPHIEKTETITEESGSTIDDIENKNESV